MIVGFLTQFVLFLLVNNEDAVTNHYNLCWEEAF